MDYGKKKLMCLLPVTMNQLVLKSVEVSPILHQTHPMPTKATLLRTLSSPAKQHVSLESLYNLGTNEAKVKSSLKLPSLVN